MFKSPVRNQRSKGIKVKHALQFCFLLAICLWLIYQVKHSHSKKKAFEEADAKESVKTVATDDGLKLGRKDLNPKEDDKPVLNIGKPHEEAEDEEAIGEEDETKIEEVTEEEATVKEDETGGDGIDEMDVHDLEKPDEEVDKEEVMEEVKDDEENSEKNDKEKDAGDNSDSSENTDSSKEEDVEDETTKSTNEAREEQYKADDASSAVTQASQTITNEKGVENSNELADKDRVGDNVNLINRTDSNNGGSNTSASSTEGQEMVVQTGSLPNITTNDTVDNLAANDDALSTIADFEQPHGFHGVRNHTSEINGDSDHSFTQNITETESDRSLLKNVGVGNATSVDGSGLQTTDLDQSNNSSLSSNINEAGSNQETSSKTHDSDSSSSSTEPLNTEKSISSSGEADVNLQSSDIKSNTGIETKPESDAKALTTDEVAVNSENADEVQQDLIGSSDTSNRLEEKDDGTELDTLANVLNEDANEEEAAAE